MGSSNVKIPAYRQAGKCQMNVKFENGVTQPFQG
jgi:hypothetical protein